MAVLTPLLLSESFGMADAVPIQDMDLQFAEVFGFVEGGNIAVGVNLAEAFGVVDAPVVIDISLALAESLGIVELLPMNSDMVMSNIKITDQFLDLFEFTELARADRVLGFDPFTRLIPGDKEYQKALLKLTVRAPTNLGDDRIGIGVTVLNVDVEDIDDRDQAVAIPAAVTSIAYTKEFKAQVSVDVTVVGGAVPLWPHVTNESLTGFDIELRDINSPFNAVAGTINWIAKGF